MKIKLIGRSNFTGVGSHFREVSQALHQQGVNFVAVDPFNDSEVQQAIDHSGPDDINICFVGADISQIQGRNIQWIPFESTRIPNGIRPALDSAAEIWPMTKWAQQVLINNGYDPEKIFVMPQAINSHVWYNTHHRHQAPLTNFLFVGKFEQRKGLAELIEAWAKTFKNSSRHRLTIKTHATYGSLQDHKVIIAMLQKYQIENYVVIWGIDSLDQVIDTYRTADVFVLPTRGEGWGRPIIEAAAMGLPIITTEYSAHGEWLQDIKSSVRWIQHSIVDIDDDDYRRIYAENNLGQWALPSVEDLCRQLIYCDENLLYLRGCAQQNIEVINNCFQWSHVVQRMISRMFDVDK